MFISKAAVRSLSSLLVFVMAAATNRKLSKRSPPAPPTTKCPSAKLYHPVAFNNTIGSPDIYEIFRAPLPLFDQPRLCQPSGIFCIGDTVANSNIVYSDAGLTNKVGKIVGTSTIVSIEEDGTVGFFTTGSVLYDTGSGLNFAGHVNESWRYQDLSVSGGTG